MNALMRSSALLLLSFLTAAAQHSEDANIQCSGVLCRMSVHTFRPLDAIAMALHSRFSIPVSAEDPVFRFRGDMMDISVEAPKLRQGTFVPARWGFELSFQTNPDGSLIDARELLRSVVSEANAQSPFGWRLDEVEGIFAFVPTRIRDAQGNLIDSTPLLDLRVTIPAGVRRVYESAQLISAELSKQTGMRVSCCESSIGGIPWGMEQMPFEATNEPARAALRRLGMTVWHVRCDAAFCFIDRR